MPNRRTWAALVAVVTAVSGQAMGQPAAAPALAPVPIRHVQIDDPFWSPKYEVWRTVTIKDCLDKFEKDGTLANFDAVASGDLKHAHGGAPWFDGLLYEMIRG